MELTRDPLGMETTSDSFSGSGSLEPLSDDGSVDEGKITEIQEQIKSNPYLYDPHVTLISLLRKAGDLDRLRVAREEMNKIFPLTPELWLDWLTDEEKLVETIEQKDAVIALFERAVQEYSSVLIWLEYVQFTIGLMSDNDSIENTRKTFERALASVGIHVVQGALIWEAYREFESALLSTLENCDAPSSDEVEKLNLQRKKISNIFRRQLSVPLMSMESTYDEFEEFSPHSVDASFKKLYQSCLKKLEHIQSYEDALFQSEPPHLSEYREYIKYEEKDGDPTRVQNIFERALIENCLVPELWTEYTAYLERVIKMENVVLPVHERAVRNCPWSLPCWKNYAIALERYLQPHDVIKGVFEKAFNSGFTQGEEYLELWVAYLDYMRRRMKLDEDDAKIKETKIEELIKVFERANEHIMTHYKESDPQCSILQYWAKVEAKYCKNVTRGRELWNDVMDHGHHAVAEMWLHYANFERIFGDEKHYRKILLKGLHSASDWPESVGNLLIAFEREEGTLESLETALEKYNAQIQRTEERRQRIQDKEAEKKAQDELHSQKRSEKQKGKKSKEMASSKSKKDDADVFKVPAPPPDDGSVASTSQGKKRSAEEAPATTEAKKPKVEEAGSSHGAIVKHDSSKDNRSAFCSNLDYGVNEETIKEMFSSVGEIEEVRLVKDFKGRSKGYCYVVFTSSEAAKEALKKDRQRLNGRPMFVSPCQDKKVANPDPQAKFKFNTGLEKNKLFIKNLPFATTEKDLEGIFKEFGPLKEVRLVTYRNGHSKGLAYVEYNDEASAKTALVKTDGMKVGEHAISVAISNPPQRKAKAEPYRYVPSLGSGSSSRGGRGRGRTQIALLPRVVQRQPQAARPKPSQPSIQNGK